MTLQSAIEAELPFLRAEAEATFTDTFTAFAYEVVKVDGLDERLYVEQYVTPGKVSGRSRQGDTNTRTVSIGGVERPVFEGGLHIPLSADLPAIGWEYVCTAVGAASDPALLGRTWRVVDVPAKSYATARRLDVVEIPEDEL
jgi:hypothetical protein